VVDPLTPFGIVAVSERCPWAVDVPLARAETPPARLSARLQVVAATEKKSSWIREAGFVSWWSPRVERGAGREIGLLVNPGDRERRQRSQRN
jgi:hypothetical protein